MGINKRKNCDLQLEMVFFFFWGNDSELGIKIMDKTIQNSNSNYWVDYKKKISGGIYKAEFKS